MSDVIAVLNTAERLAPVPESREAATRNVWVRHYAALGLAANVAFRASLGLHAPPSDPEPSFDGELLGLLANISNAATAAAAALAVANPFYASGLIYDLTPEAGALNGEWTEWLADTLDRYGINPADIDPDLKAADFESPAASEWAGASDA